MFSYPLAAKNRILLILLPALIFCGCGQKGDLLLPEDETTAASAQYNHAEFLV